MRKIKNHLIELIIYFYILLFFFLLSYTLYNAQVIHKGTQIAYYYKYYLIFIFGLIFWIIILYLNKKLKKFIIIYFSLSIFIMYGYEIGSFYNPNFLKFNFNFSFKNVNLAVEKESTKLEVINKLKKETNQNVVPSIFPSAILQNDIVLESNFIPLAGISNTTTVFCKEGKEFSIYHSDRHGFNNPNDEWDLKEISWILIGDSFVHGACVNTKEDFASQIRKHSGQSALNLGMSGNGPLLELAILKEYIQDKKINNVLWFYFERNDLSDLKIEKFNKLLLNYLIKDFSQNLIVRQNDIDNYLEKFVTKIKEKKPEIKKNAFKKIIRFQIIRDKLSLDRGLSFKVDPIFRQILEEANNFVTKKGGKLYFIYLPDKERYSKNFNKEKNSYKKKEVILILKSLNMEIIDIDEEFFLKANDHLDFFAERIYGHYNARGYEDIAKLIIEKIKN